ncbi:MAG: histidine phosphatase family protein [Anaerolineae bacterium]
MLVFYLIREGDTDPARSMDPYNMPLTLTGVESMRRWADCSREWDLQMLCSSTLRSSLDTADLLEHNAHVAVRWDLTELEDLVLDDLNYDPRATHLVSTWTPGQMEQGLISLWTRLVPAYARILLYAQTYGLQNIAIVASERVLNLLLACWLEADWRQVLRVRFSFESTKVCRVTLDDGLPVQIEYLVCPDTASHKEGS